MYPQPFTPPDLPRLMAAGEARRVARGPMTVAQVLERGRLAMDAEDLELERQRDPLAFVLAHRPRRLIDRLLGRI